MSYFISHMQAENHPFSYVLTVFCTIVGLVASEFVIGHELLKFFVAIFTALFSGLVVHLAKAFIFPPIETKIKKWKSGRK